MNETIKQQALNLFTQKYNAATSIQDATDYLSTSEIISAIKSVDSSIEVTETEVVEFLKTNGFEFTAEPGKMAFNLKWMCIRKY